MAATNVLDYMACINTGARKVILWQGKLIRHSHTISVAKSAGVWQRGWRENTVLSGQAVRLHPHKTVWRQSGVFSHALSSWSGHISLMLSVTANDSKGLDTDFKSPALALNTMPVAQTIGGTSASLRRAWSKFVPPSVTDATFGKVFSLDTRQ